MSILGVLALAMSVVVIGRGIDLAIVPIMVISTAYFLVLYNQGMSPYLAGLSGLGLSIARAVARQHGGDITLSTGGTGMQAIISLPREGIMNSVQTWKPRFWSVEHTVLVSRSTGTPEAINPSPPRST